MLSVGVKNGMGVQRNEIGPINISTVQWWEMDPEMLLVNR